MGGKGRERKREGRKRKWKEGEEGEAEILTQCILPVDAFGRFLQARRPAREYTLLPILGLVCSTTKSLFSEARREDCAEMLAPGFQ